MKNIKSKQNFYVFYGAKSRVQMVFIQLERARIALNGEL